MEKDFEDNVLSSVDKVDQQGLNTVAELAREIRNQEAQIANLEKLAKDLKKSVLKLTDDEMPAMLAELAKIEK